MKDIRTIVVLLMFCLPSFAQQRLKVPADWKQQGWTITLKDELHHPGMSWPTSLLQYRLDFGAAGVDKDRFNVTDEAGRAVPFQLSDSTLYILSGLPSGASKSFRLNERGLHRLHPVSALRRTGTAHGCRMAFYRSRYPRLVVQSRRRQFCGLAKEHNGWGTENGHPLKQAL